MRLRRGNLTIVVATALLLVSTSPGHAAAPPEQICQSGRANAAAKYTLCSEKAVAKFYLTFDAPAFGVAAGKCVTKYAATWPKLVAKGAGSTTCVDPRFVNNGTTVTDQLTALQWEKKASLDSVTNFADPHDADNSYSWTATSTAANGTAFTIFLASLNTGCFAGQCDWRLPTRDELLTIVTPAYPACTTAPCIDPALGPTVVYPYWSATTVGTGPTSAWFVNFYVGQVFPDNKSNVWYVRGVRSGL
jgi:hypothetical protein